MIINKWSRGHIILVMMTFLFIGKLHGQQTELIPYRLVPSQDVGYGCWLEIEFIGLPESLRNDEEIMDMLNRLVVQRETGEIGFHERDFRRGGKNYILVKIQVPSPYDVEPRRVEIEVDPYE